MAGGVKRKRVGDNFMEENTMAILDTSCFTKSSKHISDDSIYLYLYLYLYIHLSVSIYYSSSLINYIYRAFLSCSGFLVSMNPSTPTNKMYKAIFQILKVENSLDLIMSSYQILLELDKLFPRVYLSESEKLESSSSRNELVVVEEAWSPFSFGTDVSATDFHLLIQDLAKVQDEANNEVLDWKPVRNMLLFQYLVNVLEGDFVPRKSAFTENSDWITLRESLINKILVCRKIIYKALIKDCLSAMFELSQISTQVTEKCCHTALAIALPQVVKRTCVAVQKLLLMIIELDSLKKAADMEGWTTRADGTRTPATEIILDELTYDKDVLFPFFQVLDNPKLKLDMTIQYLQKYIPKASSRTTRRSNGSPTSDSTFGGVLKSFSNANATKSIIKKISSEVAQLLLAHAFQAYILLPSQHSTKSKEDVADNSLPEICQNMISVFKCLKKSDQHTGILPFAKEALITAATMLS